MNKLIRYILLKLDYVHNINSICYAILMNLRDDNFHLTDLDKKKIKIDIKNNLNWLKNKELVDLDLNQLRKRDKRLKKIILLLITLTNKENFNLVITILGCRTEIHGDDENDNEVHEQVKNYNDPYEFDKEEIKALKKTISDLGKNIISMINNPVSNFTLEDITFMTDYIDTVNIWLYTTSASYQHRVCRKNR